MDAVKDYTQGQWFWMDFEPMKWFPLQSHVCFCDAVVSSGLKIMTIQYRFWAAFLLYGGFYRISKYLYNIYVLQIHIIFIFIHGNIDWNYLFIYYLYTSAACHKVVNLLLVISLSGSTSPDFHPDLIPRHVSSLSIINCVSFEKLLQVFFFLKLRNFHCFVFLDLTVFFLFFFWKHVAESCRSAVP